MIPGSAVVVFLLVIPGEFGEPPREAVADVVTLRDGSAILGEVVPGVKRTETAVFTRRAWVRETYPKLAERWERAERASIKQATRERLDRLSAWRTLRKGSDEKAGRLDTWLDAEIKRLETPDGTSDAPLMRLSLWPSDLKSVVTRTASDHRLLRLGWLSGFRNPEAMTAETLGNALEGRGLDVSSKTPVAIDDLLPPRSETEAVWVSRRAATEVVNDPGLRFVRYQSMVFPEPAAGAALKPADGMMALSALKDLLGDAPEDPLPARLRELAGKGRSGALVTRLDVSPDYSRVAVEITLWLRPTSAPDRWALAGSRTASVDVDSLPADAGKEIADDPQIKSVFGLVESLGLGGIPDDLKRRSLKMGAATQKAIGQARGQAEADLAKLALPLNRAS